MEEGVAAPWAAVAVGVCYPAAPARLLQVPAGVGSPIPAVAGLRLPVRAGGLGVRSLWGIEGRWAECARWMHLSGDLLSKPQYVDRRASVCVWTHTAGRHTSRPSQSENA